MRDLGAFLGGCVLTAVVAWLAWPAQVEPASPPPAPPGIRQLGELQISSSETLRAFTIPNPDGITATACVLYVGPDARLLECPTADAMDFYREQIAQQ